MPRSFTLQIFPKTTPPKKKTPVKHFSCCCCLQARKIPEHVASVWKLQHVDATATGDPEVRAVDHDKHHATGEKFKCEDGRVLLQHHTIWQAISLTMHGMAARAYQRELVASRSGRQSSISAEFWRCYVDVMRVFVFAVGPLQLLSFPSVKLVGIRSGLPLPSGWEMFFQLLVYFLVEDYGNYWIHRLLHCKWGYEKIHRVHHEFTAPIGFAAPYAHWAEVLILGIPSFLGPAIAPGHMITFWLWIALRQMEAIETHSGYDFPLSPTKYIPFYGGAEYHDYHHYVGGQSQSNFASVFTYCDYLYGTDKGYRYQKAHLAKLREQWNVPESNEANNAMKSE